MFCSDITNEERQKKKTKYESNEQIEENKDIAEGK